MVVRKLLGFAHETIWRRKRGLSRQETASSEKKEHFVTTESEAESRKNRAKSELSAGSRCGWQSAV